MNNPTKPTTDEKLTANDNLKLVAQLINGISFNAHVSAFLAGDDIIVRIRSHLFPGDGVVDAMDQVAIAALRLDGILGGTAHFDAEARLANIEKLQNGDGLWAVLDGYLVRGPKAN